MPVIPALEKLQEYYHKCQAKHGLQSKFQTRLQNQTFHFKKKYFSRYYTHVKFLTSSNILIFVCKSILIIKKNHLFFLTFLIPNIFW